MLLRRKVWLNPAYVESHQQQACNTIRGVLVLAPLGLRPVTPGLLLETAFGRFVDSEFGLVFYSYLSIGTLNLNLNLTNSESS